MLNPEISNCHIEGCLKPGSYKAKRSPQNINEIIFLCLEHIRLHNYQWNYFQNMTQEDIVKRQADKIYLEQPTWKFGIKPHLNDLHIHQKVKEYIGVKPNTHPKAQPKYNLPEPIKNSLQELGLTYPIKRQEIKRAYRNLVKKYHPDHNPNASNQFIAIKNAYDILIEYFKE